ncbi:MAG TPA: bis(5'-nucleosyl)-tetraphosphatase [Candidatus Sulfotelmatobacter sp.]|nr:bis(5'-nucleosyl)-tetraphosphatase [Candidatus Sulfotelmatobacter sp.]
MVREFSAGVILVHRGPPREYLLLDYGTHWDFPKGHLEKGEDPETAARRELEEETGIVASPFLPGFRESMRYFYRKSGKPMLKTVTYFLAETSVTHITLSDEHSGYAWLPYREALGRLTFKTARDLLTRAEQALQAERPSVAPEDRASSTQQESDSHRWARREGGRLAD